ncbi:hypothetical protein [Streptococcus sanguinis]|uniref:hypothetical protein n=1 Tax=Streptococcus sanguinis TaxID=1305 RepID=UPI001CBCB768|nr:hypothetical protein [Streptococcus sanguinis]MBZ2039401.1 hypothetical protein [Streptococcus sanguinis]
MKAYKSTRSAISRDLWYNDWRRNSVSQCNKDEKRLAGWAIIFLGRERLRKKNGRTNQIISI